MLDASCPSCLGVGIRLMQDGTAIACPTCGGDGRKPVGDEEGERCQRDGCDGRIELIPEDGASCYCAVLGRMAPCSACTSTMPECLQCGWRMEDDA